MVGKGARLRDGIRGGPSVVARALLLSGEFDEALATRRRLALGLAHDPRVDPARVLDGDRGTVRAVLDLDAGGVPVVGHPVRLKLQDRGLHEPDIDLALGALMIAAEDRPDLEFDPTLAALDVLADRVRLRLDRGDSTDLEIERLHDVLYREWGFRPPNAAEYHATGNSQLDRVIERRIGLPITLSIVELEVAWRLGIAMHGIGLPGHF